MGTKIFFTIIFFSFTFLPVKLNAHELAEDNSVAAILHIDPEDKPIAGIEQKLIFSFNDSSKIFNLENCDCELNIFEGSSLVDQIKLNIVASTISENSYIFKNSGRHYIKLIGNPKDDAFEPFEIDYEVNVSEGMVSNFASKTFIFGFVGFNILILITVLKLYNKLNRYK